MVHAGLQGLYDRRNFLEGFSLGASAGLLTSFPSCGWAAPGGAGVRLNRLSQHLTIISGAVNGAVLTSEGVALVIGGDPRAIPVAAELVLLTHHRRDYTWAAQALVEAGTRALIPESESDKFTNVRSFWEKQPRERFHDYVQRTNKISAEPWHNVEPVGDGSVVNWRGFSIRVISTPGWTPGAVTYLANVDGRKIAFTGDLIYGDGRILDLYSLQSPIREVRALGYHGFMGRAAQLIESLRRVAAENPDILVPARGPIIHRPQKAIERLTERLRNVYRNFISISDLRWSVPERMQPMAARILGPGAGVRFGPTAEIIEGRPHWLREVDSSRLLLSESGAGFLVDCAPPPAIEKIRSLVGGNEMASIEGIYLTHYHDDHVHEAQAASDLFGCRIYGCEQIKDIVTNPRAFRMPAQSENAVRNFIALKEDESFQWREFTLTSFYFPGQTLYHGALEAKRSDGKRLWFIGDSFSPTGPADYCPQNRLFLREKAGFLACFDKLEANPDVLLVNQHISPLFRFSPEQIRHFRRTYLERYKLLRELFPWDDPNFGLDENWARFYPYEVHVSRREPVRLSVRLMNHSPTAKLFQIRPHAPRGWRVTGLHQAERIPAHEEGELSFLIQAVEPLATKVHVVTADVVMDGFEFPRWIEGLVVIDEPGASGQS